MNQNQNPLLRNNVGSILETNQISAPIIASHYLGQQIVLRADFRTDPGIKDH